MKSRGEILRAHYLGLAKRVGTWVGAISLMAGALLPATTADAAQITSRSATVSSSAGGATGVTYTVNFTPGTSGTIGSIKFEICDSPLATTSCAASSSAGVNSNGASLVGATTTGPTGTGWTGGTWNKGATTGPGTSGTSLKYTNGGTAVSPTNAQAGSWPIAAVVNPAGNNQQYYLRITTYSDTAYTTQVDFGAVALSTTQSMTVAANVQESLVFCTGTSGASCGAMSGSTVNIGTGTDNTLSSTPSGSTSLMHVTTNASSGYSITYNAANFASGANNFGNANNQTIATCASGTPNGDCFGINIVANNTAPNIAGSANVSGSTGYVSPTIQTGYGTANTYKFVSGSSQQVASTTSPTVQTDYTVSYAAQAGTTTKPGAYSTTFNWICTGTF